MTASDDSTLRIWDLSACNAEECPALEIQLPDGVARHAGFSPDGTRILSAGVDGKLHFWDVNTGSEIPFESVSGGESAQCGL